MVTYGRYLCWFTSIPSHCRHHHCSETLVRLLNGQEEYNKHLFHRMQNPDPFCHRRHAIRPPLTVFLVRSCSYNTYYVSNTSYRDHIFTGAPCNMVYKAFFPHSARHVFWCDAAQTHCHRPTFRALWQPFCASFPTQTLYVTIIHTLTHRTQWIAPFFVVLMAHHCCRKSEILVGVMALLKTPKVVFIEHSLVISPNYCMNTYMGEVCSERMEFGGNYWEDFDSASHLAFRAHYWMQMAVDGRIPTKWVPTRLLYSIYCWNIRMSLFINVFYSL